MNKQNATIGRQYKVKEKFSFKKAIVGLNPFNMVLWAKTLNTLFRFIIIGLICFGLIFGYGYYKGMGKSPIRVGYKDFKTFVQDAEGNRHIIQVKNHVLYFNKKAVRVKDIPKLKPFGIYIKPKVFVGVGSERLEAGIGVSVVHYFKFNLDVFGSQKTAYIGISREIEFKHFIENSSIGIAVGRDWDNLLNRKREDTRFMVYWSVKF